jgi:hypothetical protein
MALERWFIGALSLLICVEVVPFVLFCVESMTYHGHDAALGWFACLVFGAFIFLTISCLGWEWVLLKRREQLPNVSATVSAVVFCVGMLPGVLIIGLWLTTI